jgi:anthranilate 1,2-dioxygenase (deaminating, decarboxylating) large subunit
MKQTIKEVCMKLLRTMCIITLMSALLMCSTFAEAYDEPSVNLGFTSFLDGGPPAGPGFYFTQYLQYYTASQLNDEEGNELGLPNPNIDVIVGLSQFIYQSDRAVLLDGKWGLDVIIPLVHIETGYSATGPFPADNGGGIGDILVGPYIQWDPVMGARGPLFMHRIELQMLLPTGKYDSQREQNPGSNFFSFNPYWSGTLFITPELTSSVRFHYLWNAKNDDPNRGFVGADDSQAGQAIHINFATAYEVVPKSLRIGLNGYYLKQISDTQVDGSDVPNRKEEVLGIGPGMVYHHSQDQHLFLNLFNETLSENRTEGTRITLRYVHHF